MQPGYLQGRLTFSHCCSQASNGRHRELVWGEGGDVAGRGMPLPVLVPCSTQLRIFVIELQCDVAVLGLVAEDVGNIDTGVAKSDDDDLDRPA